MRRAVWSLLFGVGLLTVWLTRPASRVSAGAVPCVDVITGINHAVTKGQGRSPDISLLAKRLGTSPAWVEHCMRAYGRRPKRPGRESEEGREDRFEEFESAEPEESAPEDVREPGARERPIHPEKPRQLKIKPPPTFGYDDKQ